MKRENFFDLTSKSKQQWATLIILWLSIILGLFFVRAVLLPFLLASLLAYVFHPIVKFLGRIKIKNFPLPRVASVLLIYLFFSCAVILFCTLFLPQFYREMVRLAKDTTTFINSIDENSITVIGQKIESFFRRYQLPLEIIAPNSDGTPLPTIPHKANLISIDLQSLSKNILNDILFYIKSETKNILSSANHLLTELMNSVFMMVLIFMIAGFMLVDIDRIKQFFFTLVPISERSRFDNFLSQVDIRLSGVVRGQLTICLVNGVLTLIGLLILKIKFAFILATLAGIFSIIPIFGSIISTIPIFLVAVTMSPLKALLSLVWVILIHALEANLLNPKIMGDSAKIHPALIILALLAGKHFYGIIGALLAVPIISILITIFSSILNKAKGLDEGVANPVQNDRIT